MDLVADLAFPLPFAVISEMMGMPVADRDQVRQWSHALVRILDFTIGPDEMRVALQAGENMRGHLTEVIAWKRSNPADDLLSALIRAEEDGDVLSDTELLDQVMLLYIAGHETTVNLIGNGTWALLGHRDQLELWRDDPSLGSAAIDELLRYDSPVQISRRIALTDIEVGGFDVPAGAFVLTSLGSANRDPAVFGPTAEQLDLAPPRRRPPPLVRQRHAPLPRRLARPAAGGRGHRRAASAASPRLEATGEPAWSGRLVLRGMESLPLGLGLGA